jgi:hypothetical protein
MTDPLELCKSAVIMHRLFLLWLALLVQIGVASCGRIGGNYPTPTPTPNSSQEWHRVLSENGGRWNADSGEIWFLEESRLKSQFAVIPEGSAVGAPYDFAKLGGFAEGSWETSATDSGEWFLVVRDADGAERRFKLGLISTQGPLEFLKLESGDGSIVLRRPKPTR